MLLAHLVWVWIRVVCVCVWGGTEKFKNEGVSVFPGARQREDQQWYSLQVTAPLQQR